MLFAALLCCMKMARKRGGGTAQVAKRWKSRGRWQIHAKCGEIGAMARARKPSARGLCLAALFTLPLDCRRLEFQDISCIILYHISHIQ